MDASNLSKIAIVLAVAGIVISLVAVGAVLDDDDEYGVKYTMYVGMSDDSQKDEIHEYIIDIITNDLKNGFTSFDATGGYVAGDTVVKDQTTLVYVLNLIDGDAVYDIAEKVKERYGVAVMVEEQPAKAVLV